MRKTIIQFLDMFNDIVIARYNQDTGQIIKYVKVPLKFAPKTKQWYWTELREAGDRRDQVLPMMAVSLDSVDYAQDRQVNRNAKVEAKNQDGGVKRYYNPVPYDYTFSLQIAAEYMVDITQIIEQIFPFFTPEAYVRITIPELSIEGLAEDGEAGTDKLELRVVYDSASKEAPVELDEAGYRVLLWTLTFKVQGYMFSPMYDDKAIHNVIQNYYATTEGWSQRQTDVDDDLKIGEVGHATMQGVTYAIDIPEEGQPVDDEARSMFRYEHFEQPPNSEYVYDESVDDEVWLEDDDGNPIDDDTERHIRE
jgi:hypothetical protein